MGAKMIRAIFFDMYGTLAGFHPPRYEVQSQACAPFGITVTPEGVLRGYAAADAYMNEQNISSPLRLRSPEERDRFFSEYERLVLGGDGVEVSLERAGEIWRALRQLPYSLVPFDDVIPTLELLKARGLALGLISNIDQHGAELLDSLNLSGHLDFAVTSGEVGAEKPNPALFRAALSKAGARPEEAVHVGDQPSSDVEGALAVGISAVLLDRDGNHSTYDRCPRIETLDQLPGLLDEHM